ncbi:hypothetical protein GCM10022227_12670 [Streptomyces sedi]
MNRNGRPGSQGWRCESGRVCRRVAALGTRPERFAVDGDERYSRLQPSQLTTGGDGYRQGAVTPADPLGVRWVLAMETSGAGSIKRRKLTKLHGLLGATS